LSFRKLSQISEKIADFPETLKFKLSQLKFYWATFKWPKFWQWRMLGRFLGPKEKRVLFSFSFLALASAVFLMTDFYLNSTQETPAYGGSYTEGIVGSPSLINPVYSDLSDADRDMVEILFSGLMKYDLQGRIIEDLAERVEIGSDGKQISVFLKPNLFWSDGKKLTADDVAFTVKTIQDPAYKSPLATNWIGVKAEKVSENEISFQLKESYSVFRERLTLKIIPKHIWGDILPENFPLSLYNREPVGSGPYMLKKLTQDASGSIKSITVEPNPYYYGQKPYISEMIFQFFKEESGAVTAWQMGEIDGFSLHATDKIQELEQSSALSLYSYSIPRYFAVFFNLKGSDLMEMKSVREALNYATDKQKIVETVLDGNGEAVSSPILSSVYGFAEPKASFAYDPEKAKQMLDQAGFEEMEFGPREKTVQKDPSFQFSKRMESGSQGQEVSELQKCLAEFPEIYPEGTVSGYFGEKTKEAVMNFQEKYYEEILKPWGFQSGTGIVGQTTIAKLNEVCAPSETEVTSLKISLVTVNDSILLETAEELKRQWEEIGAELEIASYSVKELENDFIKTRDYQAILIGESMGMVPDPFPFWHSSQTKEPGLNLSMYESEAADALLEEARKSLDAQVRAQKLQSFQEIIIKDCPAVFLFSSDYLHLVSSEVKGTSQGVISDPSRRLSDVQEWYIKTKREWI